MRPIFLILLLGLAGCAPAAAQSQTPRSITLCYDAILDDPQDAADRAEAHCQGSGLHAAQTAGGSCGAGYARAVYQCVP